MKVGVIGIGAMGGPISENLIKGGHAVSVFNRTPGRTDRLQAQGAVVAESIGEVCQSDIVISMLADDIAVHQMLFQSDEFFASFSSGQIHISMGTIGIAMSRRLTQAHASRGGEFISAPVFGRPDTAAAASLIILAAGPAEAINRASSVFRSIGKGPVIVGEEPYQANVAKLCGNALLVTAVGTLAEVLRFAGATGMSGSELLDVLTGTIFTSPFYKTYGSMMLNGAAQPAGFKLRLALKDLRLLLEEARAAGLSLSSVGPVFDLLQHAVSQGLGESDLASVALANTPVRA